MWAAIITRVTRFGASRGVASACAVQMSEPIASVLTSSKRPFDLTSR